MPLSKKTFLHFYLPFLLGIFFYSCQEKTANKYSLFIMDKEGNEYLIETNSLENDSLDPEKEGIKVNTDEIQRELIIKNGYYYRIKKETLSKYKMGNGKLEKEAILPIKDFYLHNYTWLQNDTLLLVGGNADNTKIKYAKVETKKMTTKEGFLAIPVPSGTFNSMSIGFAKKKKDKLFIGYTYHTLSTQKYTTSDTAYLAIFNYPEMVLLHIEKDTRSTYPGVDNTVETGTFEDEKGDFYFIACPGVALGNNPNKPTGIYRIKANDEVLDTSYFFNISTSVIQNNAYSIYYLGNGKAIVRSERKDLYTNWSDHWKVPHFEFHVIDLISQETIKLALPLDKGTRRQCVIVEDEMVYISVNSSSEGNYIWSYNKKTGQLKKGLKLTGKTDFILRIDKLRY